MFKTVLAVWIPAALLTLFPAYGNAGDAVEGEHIFRRCLVCHTIAAGQPNRLGPNLHGLFDREAGKATGFAYSDGLAKASFRWDDEKLDQWLANPQNFMPGARMTFRLLDADERADVIAYLHDAAK